MTEAFNAAINSEMLRQDSKWGKERSLPPWVWLAIIGEEIGEVCSSVLPDDQDQHGNTREELVQVAASATQWLLQLRREGYDITMHSEHKLAWLSSKLVSNPSRLSENGVEVLFGEAGQMAVWWWEDRFEPLRRQQKIWAIFRVILVCFIWYEMLNLDKVGMPLRDLDMFVPDVLYSGVKEG